MDSAILKPQGNPPCGNPNPYRSQQRRYRWCTNVELLPQVREKKMTLEVIIMQMVNFCIATVQKKEFWLAKDLWISDGIDIADLRNANDFWPQRAHHNNATDFERKFFAVDTDKHLFARAYFSAPCADDMAAFLHRRLRADPP